MEFITFRKEAQYEPNETEISNEAMMKIRRRHVGREALLNVVGK